MEEEAQAPQTSGLGKTVQVPSPLEAAVNEQMKVETQLLKGKGLGVGEFEARLEERREQAKKRLLRDDSRFQKTTEAVTQKVSIPVVIAAPEPEPAKVREIPVNVQTKEETEKTPNTVSRIRSKVQETFSRFRKPAAVDDQPSLQDLVSIRKFSREDRAQLAREYIEGRGLDAQAERYIKEHFGEDVLTGIRDLKPTKPDSTFHPDDENL